MTQTVLILGGSGKIGSHAATTFWNAGWTVRHYDRKTDDMTKAAMGADVIVNGLNPPMYHDWKRTIPAITNQVIAAAKASGATVIIPGNIYNFGIINGPIDLTTPQYANSRKGQIRIAMENAYRAAGVKTIVLRAGNFIDPDRNGDVMSMLVMRDVKKGKISYAGNPDSRQAYAFVPDWARAALALAEKRDELERFTDVPFPGHTFTLRELTATLGTLTGRTFRLTAFPWWLMAAVSPFVEVAREMREMRYLYEMDHWIGSETFNALLPDFAPTALEDVMLAGLPDDIHPNKPVRASSQAIVA